MEEELEGLYQAMRCERDKLRKELEQTQRAAQRSEEILTEENAELREKLAKAEKDAFRRGAECAASEARTYNGCTSHPYDLGDCILGKMNLSDTLRNNDRANSALKTALDKCKWLEASIAKGGKALASLSSPAPEKTPETREIPTVTTTTPAPPKVMSRHFGQTFLSVQLSCGHSRSYKAPPLPEIGETVACYECEVAHLKTQETPAVEDEGGKAAKPKRYFANQCPDCGHCDCSQHFDEDSGTFFTCCSCGTSFSYPNPPASPSLPSPSATEGGEPR